MTVLLVCSVVMAFAGFVLASVIGGFGNDRQGRETARLAVIVALVFHTLALWLAYTAGGAS